MYEQYAIDCYKHIPGQIMVSATIVKNTFGVRNQELNKRSHADINSLA